MGKRPLERCTVAVTGDFGGQRSAGQVRKRIYVHGGTFASDVSPAVTHLVCSKEDFGKDVAMVRKARRLGSVKIVSWDWLEDALTKEHPVEETEYLMTAPVAECAAKSKEEKKAVRKENIKTGMEQFEKGCQEFKEAMFSADYHIHHDSTNTTHDITLARPNLLVRKSDRFALKLSHPTYTPPHRRLLPPNPIITTPLFPTVPLSPRARARIRTPRAQRLQLYESAGDPRRYACYCQCSSPGGAPASEVLAPVGGSWETAWDAFRGFFELKTGTRWEERWGGRGGGE